MTDDYYVELLTSMSVLIVCIMFGECFNDFSVRYLLLVVKTERFIIYGSRREETVGLIGTSLECSPLAKSLHRSHLLL